MWIGSTPDHRRILVVVGLALLGGMLPAVVVAHEPTEGKREYLADNHHQFYSPGIWPGGIPAPSWVQTNVNSALNGDWDNTNVTRSPFFSLPVAGATEIATIYWAT